MHERQTNDIKNIRNMRYFEKIKNKGKPMPSSDNSEISQFNEKGGASIGRLQQGQTLSEKLSIDLRILTR